MSITHSPGSSNPSKLSKPEGVFAPFENESEITQWDSFQIENRLDRITLSGDLDITKDGEGLAKALQIKQLIDRVVHVLQTLELPEHIQVQATTRIKNPFD